MKISISSGVGRGDTKLAAFDAALWGAGIANFNLIKLSSVIPPKSQVAIGHPRLQNGKHYGDRLYVVLAEKREGDIGREAWAGIGWVQAKDGRGLFVEHEGSQQAEVIRLIEDTLTNMVKYRKEEYGPIQYQVVGVRCRRKPVCAIVVAVYERASWGK